MRCTLYMPYFKSPIIIEHCTKQFIGEELILVIGNFSENSPILKLPILKNYVDMPIKP